MSPVHLPAIPPALSAKDKPKKPRHRHSPAQLAALNELFDKDEHPPLELRTHLAEQLGMETKTVNAWFQNKRASSKKRSRAASYSVSHINNFVDAAPPQSQPVSNHYTELFDDFQDDDYPLDNRHPSAPILHSDHYRSSFFTSNSDTPTAYDADSMPRRLRLRPTVGQTEELKKLYNITQHPSAEQRQILADQIGMRYQSITNWFQNQRSIAKKKRDDDPDASYPSHPDSLSDDRTDYAAYSGLPPPSDHPSLWHNAAYPRNGRRSPSASPSTSDRSPRQRMSSRRSSTPYSSSVPSLSRPRRSRPEPHQLDALKELYTKTSTPSIEERTALALEIGMDVGKVTNWFRNLRQTARKRVKRTRKRRDDDEDGGQGSYSTSASRSGTPSLRSTSPSMDLDPEDDDLHANHSDNGSDDEHQEAVTPPPDTEASPPASAPSSRIAISHLSLSIDSASYAELEKLSATQYSGVKIEDALLLLSFHQHIVH